MMSHLVFKTILLQNAKKCNRKMEKSLSFGGFLCYTYYLGTKGLLEDMMKRGKI